MTIALQPDGALLQLFFFLFFCIFWGKNINCTQLLLKQHRSLNAPNYHTHHHQHMAKEVDCPKEDGENEGPYNYMDGNAEIE